MSKQTTKGKLASIKYWLAAIWAVVCKAVQNPTLYGPNIMKKYAYFSCRMDKDEVRTLIETMMFSKDSKEFTFGFGSTGSPFFLGSSLDKRQSLEWVRSSSTIQVASQIVLFKIILAKDSETYGLPPCVCLNDLSHRKEEEEVIFFSGVPVVIEGK
mmetsp:Transcript_11683/g.17725  ORF Transcript_11683/g.17725 Transcript_11683/m.17725 type:complete len:156 (-) Transcript_11683:735-1202(-)